MKPINMLRSICGGCNEPLNNEFALVEAGAELPSLKIDPALHPKQPGLSKKHYDLLRKTHILGFLRRAHDSGLLTIEQIAGMLSISQDDAFHALKQ